MENKNIRRLGAQAEICMREIMRYRHDHGNEEIGALNALRHAYWNSKVNPYVAGLYMMALHELHYRRHVHTVGYEFLKVVNPDTIMFERETFGNVRIDDPNLDRMINEDIKAFEPPIGKNIFVVTDGDYDNAEITDMNCIVGEFIDGFYDINDRSTFESERGSVTLDCPLRVSFPIEAYYSWTNWRHAPWETHHGVVYYNEASARLNDRLSEMLNKYGI